MNSHTDVGKVFNHFEEIGLENIQSVIFSVKAGCFEEVKSTNENILFQYLLDHFHLSPNIVSRYYTF